MLSDSVHILLPFFRQTQWDLPSWDGVAPDDSMDLESPLYEEIVKVWQANACSRCIQQGGAMMLPFD